MHKLMEAVKAGDAGEVGRMLDEDASLLRARTADGVSAISLAMYHGKPEIAKLFVEKGAVLDVFEASAVGELSRVREIVESEDAVKDAFSSDGFVPVALAAFFGHGDVVEYLLGKGVDVNATSRNAQSVRPIHAAVARRDAAIVRALLERGADPKAEQQGGVTPVTAAEAHGDREIIDLLKKYGA